MKKYFLISFLVTLSFLGYSQQYKTAIGVKGDWSTLGVDMAQFSIKHFYRDANAFEINFGAGRRYIWLEGLAVRNFDMKQGFDWYVGGGGDFGYWNVNYDKRYDPNLTTGFWLGATGVLGIEKTFSVVPLNVALDLGPTIRAIPDLEVGLKLGFSLRYAFGASRRGAY